MTRQLFSYWSEMNEALTLVLSQTSQRLWIFDSDLQRLELHSPAAKDRLLPLLQLPNNGAPRIRIILQDSQYFQYRSPRLFSLYQDYRHNFEALLTPPHLAHLPDSMVLADNSHAVVRFQRDQARGKVLLHDDEECAPYFKRFQGILEEGCSPIPSGNLGL